MRPIKTILQTFILLQASLLLAQVSNSSLLEAKKNIKISQKYLLDLECKKSLVYAEKALNYGLKNNDFIIAAKSYNLIALNFEEFGDLNKAISFYEKGISQVESTKNDTVAGWLYNNIGGVYSYNKIDLKKGLYYYKKALEKSIAIGDEWEVLYTNLNIAINLINLKDYKQGYNYLNKIKDKIDASNELEAKLSLYSLYGAYYSDYENNYSKAEESFLKAVGFGEKVEIELVKLNLVDLYSDVSNFYAKFKVDDKAYHFLKLHDKLEDEIFNEKRLNFLNNEYKSINLGETNNRILKIENENKDYVKKLRNSRIFNISLVVLVLLFLFMLYVFYRNLKKNTHVNKRLKNANLELKKAKSQSEEATRLKTQFISTVSHELRTPLYGIIGMTEVIENEYKELSTSKYFNALKFSSKYLLSLINDILNVYKIEEGKIELLPENIHLKNEIQIIIDTLQFIASQNSNEIKLLIDENVPTCITIDKTRFSQIIVNLLSNSLKFTKNGTVLLKIQNENDAFLKFQVIDTGVGIPKEYLDKIFDKFVQVERNSDEHYQGTGLGLSIVKKTVEIFGGKIQIESIENVGTDVSFTLPLIACNEQFVLKDTSETTVNLNFTCTILVVEDNKVNQMVTKKLLERNNMCCTIADDGIHAIEILEKENFDLILMDINMPRLNGFETTKLLRQKGLKTPIIALTASDRHEIEQEISEAGLNDALVKPFEFHDLMVLIQKYYKH